MAMRLPAPLMHTVYSKLLASQFDALDSFEVQYVEDEGFQMVAKRDLEAGKDVWILDHLWTTTATQAPKQLREIDGLIDRLWTIADMDFRLELERQARVARVTEAQAAAATAAPVAAASSAPVTAAAPVEIDEDSLCAIMSEASVSRDRALEAYTANKGDLISSITWLAGESERETQMKASMMAMAEAQAAAQGIGAPAPVLAPEDAQPFDSSTLSRDAKADLLWTHLFKAGLVGSYFTTLANDVSPSALRNEDVQSTLFVNDEVGSAVGQANDAANANATMAPLVAVTLGGVGFSLLWLTKDVKEGDEILIPKRPAIRLPGVPQV